MSLAKRVEEVEDNFTPREAVICWMREAHQFDSLLDYGLWLLDQPDDAYPLIRMPKQAVAAVRRKHKGTPDLRLRDQFYRVQKDVLFLYHLHTQVNLRALQEEETLRLRVTLQSERLRSLICHSAAVDGRRVERLKLPDEVRAPLPRRTHRTTKEEIELDEALDAWLFEENLVWGKVVASREAERLILAAVSGGRRSSLSPLGPGAARGVGIPGQCKGHLPDHDRTEAAGVRGRVAAVGLEGVETGFSRPPVRVRRPRGRGEAGHREGSPQSGQGAHDSGES